MNELTAKYERDYKTIIEFYGKLYVNNLKEGRYCIGCVKEGSFFTEFNIYGLNNISGMICEKEECKESFYKEIFDIIRKTFQFNLKISKNSFEYLGKNIHIIRYWKQSKMMKSCEKFKDVKIITLC